MFDRIVNKIAFGLGMAMVYSLLFLWIGYVKGMETVETKNINYVFSYGQYSRAYLLFRFIYF